MPHLRTWAVALLLLAAPATAPGLRAAPDEVPAWAKVSEAQTAAARAEGVPVAFENGVGMPFVLVPAGTFAMGSPAGEAARDLDEVSHEVTLSRPRYVQVTETTNEQVRRWRPDHDAKGRFPGGRYPAVLLSWEDAKAFAAWLTEQDGTRTYDLPTEAEWEHACRAGTATAYASGDAEADLSRAGWWWGNSGAAAHPVGEKAPNAWGLFDLHGNVWEWCSDVYAPYPEGSATDPVGPPKGVARVVRGGSWLATAKGCRSAYRDGGLPFHQAGTVGVRFVVRLPAKAGAR